MPACIVRVLLNVYKNRTVCTDWNWVCSDALNVTNFIRQGWVTLFTLLCYNLCSMYVNPMEKNFLLPLVLQKQNVWCLINPNVAKLFSAHKN